MGNYYCKKCGICINYFNQHNLGRPSCRSHTYQNTFKKKCMRCNGSGHCYHDFEYYLFPCLRKTYVPKKQKQTNRYQVI